MEIFAGIRLSKGVVIIFIVSIFGLHIVSAQTGATGAAENTSQLENTTPVTTVSGPPSSRTPSYPKCIVSCTDEKRQNLPDGDYAYCSNCNKFVKCTNSYLYIFDCPLGTNYYDRILGVCVTDSNVCINDSLTATNPTVMIPTATEVTTSSSSTTLLPTTTPAVTTTGAGTTSTTAVETTRVVDVTKGESATTTSTAVTTTTSTSSTVPTTSTVPYFTTAAATSTSSPKPSTTMPSTVVAQSSTTQVVTSSSTNATTPTTSRPIPTTSTTTVSTTTVDVVNTTGYIPSPGGETESFLFAVDLYNKHSQNKMRAGALRVNSVKVQPLGSGLSDTWYRLFGVMLVQSMCPNTAENMRADYQKCPLITSATLKSNQSIVALCDFKVQYSPQSSSSTNRLEMIYMMCYK